MSDLGKGSFIRNYWFILLFFFVVFGIVALWQYSEVKPDSYAASVWTYILDNALRPAHESITATHAVAPYVVGGIVMLVLIVSVRNLWMRRGAIKQKIAPRPITPTPINPSPLVVNPQPVVKATQEAVTKTAAELEAEAEKLEQAA